MEDSGAALGRFIALLIAVVVAVLLVWYITGPLHKAPTIKTQGGNMTINVVMPTTVAGGSSQVVGTQPTPTTAPQDNSAASNVGMTGSGTSNGCGSNPADDCTSSEAYGGVAAYAQTGKNNPKPAHWAFIVPSGYGMVVGGYQVTGSVNSANQPGAPTDPAHAGALAAFPSGANVSVDVVDGFYVLVPQGNLKGELCNRLGQARAKGWSNGRVFTPQEWGDKPCG